MITPDRCQQDHEWQMERERDRMWDDDVVNDYDDYDWEDDDSVMYE